ncbi:hypothetical protein [Candidatus Regiella endosymbiont of Tuberolachnus salignus]|uniref:hypothetical protein n=1 Tax=Candidatus Regiella endosymbiont of Tuberolachnus salignus TaxID=3077956 RepID=UPI0030CAC1A6
MLAILIIPFAFEVAFGGQGARPMSVDRLRDSANTRSQQRCDFKGGGYIRMSTTVALRRCAMLPSHHCDGSARNLLYA